MGTIWVREFTGGLDTRRLPETSSGAVLIKATNGHVSRGGEFEKRAAFVPTYSLPAGTTYGMAYDKSGIYVFGHLAAGSVGTLPAGVNYQRLQHPDGSTALARILSFDLYAGKIYVVAEFVDGGRYHFYDGAIVPSMKDGRARASFTVTGGSVTAAVAATGSFKVTGGSAGVGNQVTDLKINGVSIIFGPVAFNTDTSVTAQRLAEAISTHVSTPDYTATAVGNTVTVTAVTKDATVNGLPIVATVGGDVTVGNVVNMSGGSVAVTSTLSALTVAGVSIIPGPILWRTSNTATAAAIVEAINTFASNPDYRATQVGAKVNILAGAPGAAANGRAVAYTASNGLTLSPGSGFTLAGGNDPVGTGDKDYTYLPGTFVKTIGSRMHTVSGQNEHGSGLQAPTKWTTDTTGAFFIDMSTHAAGAEDLKALAKYQKWVAVFAERIIQIWYFDSDPTQNSQQQVLNNTGTASPRSVTQFGDNDLFYCAESGLRSLRARDASNAAATTDIGVPVDTLVVSKLQSLTADERDRVTGLIEPRDGRFWLVMKDVIFVFSYFPGAKISAWSTYEPGFDVEDVIVFKRRVYVRAGDTIYAYGGVGNTLEYDTTQAVAWLPYLDGEAPTRIKHIEGMDAAVFGQWQTSWALSASDQEAHDTGPIVTATTYGQESIPLAGAATHVSPRFTSVGSGPAKLGAVVIHFEFDADSD